MTFLKTRHLIQIDDLSLSDVHLLFEWAKQFESMTAGDFLKVPFLRGQVVANVFLEPSTRTLLSFEVAAKKLQAEVIRFHANESSLEKGESLLDTLLNIQALGASKVVIRHFESGKVRELSQTLHVSVINAGDGYNEHPTQALLDAYTLMKHFGRSKEEGLSHLRIAIVGDLKHSRVARSNMCLLPRLGAKVVVAGPPNLMPDSFENSQIEVAPSIDDAIIDADVVMMLRIQKERFQSQGVLIDENYLQRFGLTKERFSQMPSHAQVMHPGPMNRGIEIDSDVANDPRSLILNQARNGVYIRMAVLYGL